MGRANLNSLAFPGFPNITLSWLGDPTPNRSAGRSNVGTRVKLRAKLIPTEAYINWIRFECGIRIPRFDLDALPA